ncbi:MAG TPA: hypothetical protein VER39_05490 [Nocardioidaceae bacterium]|nr:hypothetical protein [Nocardioidaceae bacterium]
MTASTNESRPRSGQRPEPRLRSVPDQDADVTELDKVRADRLTAAQQRRAATRTRDLCALLHERPDLVGVHAPADFSIDALRWCV